MHRFNGLLWTIVLLALFGRAPSLRADCTDYSHSMQWVWGQRITYYIPGWQYENGTFDLAKAGSKVLVAHYPDGLYAYEETSAGQLAARGTYSFPVRGVAAVGNRAYTIDYVDGFRVVNTTNLNTMTTIAHLPLNSAFHLEVAGGYAYVSTFADLTIIRLQEPAPTIVGHLAVDAVRLAIRGNRAYIATSSKLVVADISNPAAPAVIGTAWTSPNLWDVVVDGNLLYLADSAYGLRVFALSNPDVPALIGGVPRSNAQYLAVGSGLVLVGDDSSFTVVDVANPNAPLIRDQYRGSGLRGGVLESGLAYLASYTYGIQEMTLGDAPMPSPLASQLSGAKGSYLSVEGTRLEMLVPGALRVFDRSDPLHPSLVGSLPMTVPRCMAVDGNTAYVVDGSTLRVISLSNPAAPTQLGTLANSSADYIAYAAGRVYLTSFWSGIISVVDVSNPAAPFLLAAPSLYGQFEGLTAKGRTVCAIWNFEGSGFVDAYDFTSPSSPALLTEVWMHDHLTNVRYLGDDLYSGSSAQTYLHDPATFEPAQQLGENVFGGLIGAGTNGRVYRLTSGGVFEVARHADALTYVAEGVTPLSGGHGIVEADGWIYVTDDLALRVFGSPCAAAVPGEALASRADLRAMPNPLRQGTEFRFDPAFSGPVNLTIYDASGRARRHLQFDADGATRVLWDGSDDANRPLPNGVYFARLASGGLLRSTPVVIAR